MLVSIDKTVGDLQEICGEHRKPTRCSMDCPLVYICGVMVKDWTVGIIKNEEDTMWERR